jgi:hypothetical protein
MIENIINVKTFRSGYYIAEFGEGNFRSRANLSPKNFNVVMNGRAVYLPDCCYLLKRLSDREKNLLMEFWLKGKE